MGDMGAFLDAGVTAFDCADIYTGVEEMIGAFRERLLRERGEAAARALKVHTKFVPDWDALPTLSRSDVRGIVERSLRRLRAERLDLVQFHWWNYDAPGMIEAAGHLLDLQRQGKIDLLGGTNFDTARSRRADRGRHPARLHAGPVFPSRRPARGRPWRPCAPRRG